MSDLPPNSHVLIKVLTWRHLDTNIQQSKCHIWHIIQTFDWMFIENCSLATQGSEPGCKGPFIAVAAIKYLFLLLLFEITLSLARSCSCSRRSFLVSSWLFPISRRLGCASVSWRCTSSPHFKTHIHTHRVRERC